ncbi:MAG: universal stress protein [Dokdonia sp.]|jgi:nucleotide-binding universal stress UspA family protein|nr:hypothetical protein [Cytophagaceae bacterium]
MKRIAVPTDFSNNAYNALLYATKLLATESASIVLIHSFEDEFSRSTSRIDIGKSDDLYQKVEKRVQREFDILKKSIQADTSGMDISFETLMTGLPLDRFINKLVNDERIDFVVMGTKGATGLQEVFMGSQTVRLIKKIKQAPVLAIPQEAKVQPPKTIVFATDFKKPIAANGLHLLKELMRLHHPALKITHIYNQKQPESHIESQYKALKAALGDIESTMHWLENASKKETILDDFIKKTSADLLVLTHHKKSFLQRLFQEDVVENLGFHSKIPLLVLKDE